MLSYKNCEFQLVLVAALDKFNGRFLSQNGVEWVKEALPCWDGNEGMADLYTREWKSWKGIAKIIFLQGP